jgi:4-coumarate--CoA ligase
VPVSKSQSASDLTGSVPLITMDNSIAHTPNLAGLISQSPADISIFDIDTAEKANNADAFINRTSGSTGAMKSVLTTHRHYIVTLEGTARTVGFPVRPLVSSSMPSYLCP